MIQLADVKRVLAESQGNTLSLYLHVDAGYKENQSTNPAWAIWLKNALRDLAPKDEAHQAQWRDATKKLDAYLQGYSPSGKTLVVFLGPETEEFIHLPVALENAGDFGEPLVTPMLWAMDEFERYLVALVDQEQARFVSAYLGHADTSDELTIDLDDYDFREKTLMPYRRGGPGAGFVTSGNNREEFEDRIDAHTERFYKEVINHIEKLVDEIGADRIILGGIEKTAHAIRDGLHSSYARRLVGVLPIPMETEDHAISRHILEAATRYERDFEMNQVNDVINRAKAEGRGALGKEAVMRAMEMQQVQMLLLPWPMEDKALAADLSLRALQNSVEIELVHGSAAQRLREEAEIAARLYYTVGSSEKA